MLRIAKADLTGQGSNLTLEAIVIAPTLGWKVELSPMVYIKPPEDGIQEFELIGTPPTGVVGQALEAHELKVPVPGSDWTRGVGITSSSEMLLKILTPMTKQNAVGSDHVLMAQPGIRNRDKLMIPVRYGGGCKKHKFQLNWDGQIMESAPPQVNLELSHNANGDTCRDLVSDDLQFDLSVLAGLPQNGVVLRVKSSINEYIVNYKV